MKAVDVINKQSGQKQFTLFHSSDHGSDSVTL